MAVSADVGGSVEIEGTNKKELYCLSNSTCTVKAIPNQNYHFYRWSDGDTQNHEVLMDRNRNLTAHFYYYDTSLVDKAQFLTEGQQILNFYQGKYMIILVGHGGAGGRSNPVENQIQGAFGGGSGAALSGNYYSNNNFICKMSTINFT